MDRALHKRGEGEMERGRDGEGEGGGRRRGREKGKGRRENEQLHVYLYVITTSSLGSWRGKQEFVFGLKDFAKSLPVRQTVTCAGFQERFVHDVITALLQVVATLEFVILWAEEEKPSVCRRGIFPRKIWP